MGVKLLTEHHLNLLSLKGDYTGTSKSILVQCQIVENHISRLNFGNAMLSSLFPSSHFFFRGFGGFLFMKSFQCCQDVKSL